MPGAPSNQPCLTVLGGPMSGTQFVIEDAVDNILIGADSSCKFCIPLPGVSPIHARIWLDAGGAIVYDTHSPRGLYVNDDRVNGEAPLKNGDILWLGTPGEEDVVMIQCRLPRAAPAIESSVPPPASEGPEVVEVPVDLEAPEPPEVNEPSEAPQATLVMASDPGLPALETPPPDASEFYVAVEEESPPAAALYEEVPEPVPPGIEATTVLDGPPADIDEAYISPPAEEPPPLLTPPPPPPASTLETEFEDETSALEPPPPEPETIAVAPEPRPLPTPPPPAPVRAESPPPARTTTPARPVSAPRPAPSAPKPSPAPTLAPRSESPPASSPMRGIVLAAGIAAIVIVGSFLTWRWLRPNRTALVTPAPAPVSTTLPAAAPSTTVPPTPAPVAETPAPAPPVEEVVTIVKSPSPRAPSPSPSASKPSPPPKGQPTPSTVATPAGPSPEEQRAQALATQVAGLLTQAEAVAAAKPEDALRLYDEVLKLDPQNARAAAGKAATQGAANVSRRRFAAGRTSILSAKAKTDVSGFDSADVQVADAPGRIDFEVTPAAVKPGDTYAVKVYFANESKKAIKVKSLSVSTSANGARTGGPATPQAREIGPGQRTLLGEIGGAWKDGTTTWSTDVIMISERNDTYRNQVSWR